MTAKPKFKLSRLREIGWTSWNPIGLNGSDWPQDEYDSYLLAAVGKLWNGASVQEVSEYLVCIEYSYMGLSDAENRIERAQATVSALADYVVELRK